MANSSRRSNRRLIAGAFGLAFGAAAAVAFASVAPGRAEETGPVLVIASPSDSSADARRDRSAALVLAGLPDSEVARSARALDELAERASLQQNPLVEDLGEGEPADSLMGWARDHAPSLAAADAIAESPFVSADGALAVSVAPRCPEGARCAPLYSASRDPEWARAAFVAWPLTASIVLRGSDDACASAITSALRAHAGGSAGRVALALREVDAQRTDTTNETRVRASAMTATVASTAPRLAAMARPRPTARLFPPIGLASNDVLVVPRLSSLADHEGFVAEAVAVAGGVCRVEIARRGSSP